MILAYEDISSRAYGLLLINRQLMKKEKRMKRVIGMLSGILLSLAITGTSNAALWDRGSGLACVGACGRKSSRLGCC